MDAIGWDASKRLFAPDELLRPELPALAAALVSILAKEWLYWWTLGYARRIRSNLLRANAWHHRSDAVSSVVMLVGIGGTLVGLPYLDALATIVIAAMITRMAWKLGRQSIRELVDTGLEAERLAAIRKTIGSVGDEITDVTVHIDPENDEAEPASVELPTRAEALARLGQLWEGVSGAEKRQSTILHYLNGRIDVEVYFPLDLCAGERSRAEDVRERLQLALAADSVFNQVFVYFG